MGEHFHPDCFICGKCKNPIKGQFKTEEGVRICMNCNPIVYCEACKKAVSGSMLKFEGKVYHSQCFKCIECGGSLLEGVCCKDDKMFCRKCIHSYSSGKVRVMNTCKKCEKQLEAGGSGIAVAGGWFCNECFTCAHCTCLLDPQSFVLDKVLRNNNEYACLCQSCAANAAEPVTLVPTLCLVCHETCEEDAGPLLDGQVIHRACTKCKSCGSTEDADKPGLLTAKMKLLKSGQYLCAKCSEATNTELGTYGGKGKVGRDDISYCVRLRPRHIFWLDYTSMNPISTSSWHAEGKYTRTPKADGGASLTFTVEGCPFGGGPKVGAVYTAEIEADGSAILVEGIRCEKTAQEAFLEESEAQRSSPSKLRANAVGAASPGPAQQASAAETATLPQPGTVPPEAAVPAAPAPPRALLTYEQLKDPAVCSAHGVDPASKEACLSDVDFVKVFGTCREDFMKLPKWKRDKQKKDLGLF